nr:hypothetical protein [Tanacetum cinerariifolium]
MVKLAGNLLILLEVPNTHPTVKLGWEITECGSVKSVFQAWEQRLSSFEYADAGYLVKYRYADAGYLVKYRYGSGQLLSMVMDLLRLGNTLVVPSLVVKMRHTILRHLMQRGIIASYENWIHHGEPYDDLDDSDDDMPISEDSEGDNDMDDEDLEFYQDQELHLDLIDDLNMGLPSLARGDVPLEVVDKSKIGDNSSKKSTQNMHLMDEGFIDDDGDKDDGDDEDDDADDIDLTGLEYSENEKPSEDDCNDWE